VEVFWIALTVVNHFLSTDPRTHEVADVVAGNLASGVCRFPLACPSVLTKETPEAKELESELIPGKAEFLADFDQEERDDYIRKEEQGWGKVIKQFRDAFKS